MNITIVELREGDSLLLHFSPEANASEVVKIVEMTKAATKNAVNVVPLMNCVGVSLLRHSLANVKDEPHARLARGVRQHDS
jgi:hypothetical protein